MEPGARGIGYCVLCLGHCASGILHQELYPKSRALSLRIRDFGFWDYLAIDLTLKIDYHYSPN